ncbi:MAG: hypothetical protein WD533_05625 [Dehalococcoidia bacterium]
MLHPTSRFRSPLTAVVLLIMLALTACGSGDPTPAPSPTPSPTPEPPLAAPFLDLSADSTFGDVLQRLPADERDCLQEGLSPEQAEALESQPAFQDGDAQPWEAGLDPECLSRDTIIGLLSGGVAQQAGGLGNASLRCIENTFAGVDVEAFAQGQSDPDPGQQQESLGAAVALLLCLTEEEAARVEVGDALGGEALPITLQDLRCVVQQVEVDLLTRLLGALDGAEQTEPPTEEQQRRLAEAFGACDIQLPGSSAGGV